jgi:hypothetical protein
MGSFGVAAQDLEGKNTSLDALHRTFRFKFKLYDIFLFKIILTYVGVLVKFSSISGSILTTFQNLNYV